MKGKSVKRNTGHKGRSATILPNYKDVNIHINISYLKKQKQEKT